ncbi:MAG: hypothetical protein KDC44_04545, partial [Phaeodactylibacter sp.]|nr:hypothetical protein [Phaeodactylibacter sp.]
SGPAEKGKWVRAVPVEAKVLEGDITNPGADSPNDWGSYCFLTGNGAGEAYADELDGGQTILSSPLFDLSGYNHPQLRFEYWFVNLEQESRPANDSLSIYLSNGADKVLIFKTKQSQFEWHEPVQIDLAGLLPFTAQMQLEVVTGDLPESSNLVEAAIDNLQIVERVPDEAYLLQDDWARAFAFPNPFSDQFQVDYQLDKEADSYRYEVLDALGRRMFSGTLAGPHGSLKLYTDQLPPGLYSIRFFAGSEASAALKLICI